MPKAISRKQKIRYRKGSYNFFTKIDMFKKVKDILNTLNKALTHGSDFKFLCDVFKMHKNYTEKLNNDLNKSEYIIEIKVDEICSHQGNSYCFFIKGNNSNDSNEYIDISTNPKHYTERKNKTQKLSLQRLSRVFRNVIQYQIDIFRGDKLGLEVDHCGLYDFKDIVHSFSNEFKICDETEIFIPDPKFPDTDKTITNKDILEKFKKYHSKYAKYQLLTQEEHNLKTKNTDFQKINFIKK